MRHSPCRVPALEESLHGEVRQESAEQSQARNARTQARDVEVRALGQEGQESEAGDRDRAERSAPGWRESAAKARRAQAQERGTKKVTSQTSDFGLLSKARSSS